MYTQFLNGKAPIGIAKLAKEYGLPVAVIVGSKDTEMTELYKNGIDLIIDIIKKPMTIEESMKNVEALVESAAETVYRAYEFGQLKAEKTNILSKLMP